MTSSTSSTTAPTTTPCSPSTAGATPAAGSPTPSTRWTKPIAYSRRWSNDPLHRARQGQARVRAEGQEISARGRRRRHLHRALGRLVRRLRRLLGSALLRHRGPRLRRQRRGRNQLHEGGSVRARRRRPPKFRFCTDAVGDKLYAPLFEQW